MARRSLLRQLLGLVVPVIVGVLIGVALLEVAARVAWNENWQDGVASVGGPEPLNEITTLMQLASRNVRGVSGGVPYRTNDLGVRGPDYARVPDEGVFRILVAGDSTTMGAGVLEEDRYSDRLERLLNQAGERRYQVVNIGLSGLNINQVMNRLERLLPFYPSDLLVYGFSLNDIEGSSAASVDASDYESSRERTLEYLDLVARARRSRSYLMRYAIALQLRASHGASGRSDEIRRQYFDDPAAWQEFLVGLDRLAAIAREREVCASVFIQTKLDQLNEDHLYLDVYDRVARAASDRGLNLVSSFGHLEGRDAEDLWVSLLDPHPNREGHEILAQSLRDGLAALPPECIEKPRASDDTAR